MDIRIGDGLRLKKEHPCGSREWEVVRIGADIKLRCRICGREVMSPREKIEKKVKRILRDGKEINPHQEGETRL